MRNQILTFDYMTIRTNHVRENVMVQRGNFGVDEGNLTVRNYGFTIILNVNVIPVVRVY